MGGDCALGTPAASGDALVTLIVGVGRAETGTGAPAVPTGSPSPCVTGAEAGSLLGGWGFTQVNSSRLGSGSQGLSFPVQHLVGGRHLTVLSTTHTVCRGRAALIVTHCV